MLTEARTKQYSRDKHKSPIIVQMKGNVFLFHFQNVSSDAHDFFFLAFEVNAIDRIRIFVITSWLPSFHKQEFKTQYSVSHSAPSSVSFFLIVIMATYHPLPEFLPILVTSVLFNKIQCITYSFQLNTWEKKKPRNNCFSLFSLKLMIFHFANFCFHDLIIIAIVINTCRVLYVRYCSKLFILYT